MYLKLLKVLMFASKQLFYVFLVQVVAMQLLLATNSNSQKLEEIFVDLTVENVSLQQILDQISHKTNFAIGYETNLVNKDEKYTFVSKGKNFELLLLEIAKKAEVKFKRINNKLLVSKDPRNTAENKIEIVLEVDISGKISDENGEGLPGASVVIKGSAIGTTTDLDGNYKLSVSSDATLVISFVGYKTQEIIVGSQSVIDLKMQVDSEQLEEVVVTALGIEKDVKALGYAVTQLEGEGFTEAREINIGNALSGKVAGVNVSNIASGPGGSTRVIIRGNSSISGNNQPLYVVDGVPIDNTNLGSAGTWGGHDWGDGLSSLNPDDIESMTVLKGNSASALYGSRASNGVILITTKKGKNRKGVGVEFNSNLTFEKINNTYDDLQQEYGQGRKGVRPTTTEEAKSFDRNSWGAKMDGALGYQFDGVQRPYAYAGSNFDNYYETGTTFSNTVALSAGDENKNIRVSISDMKNNSIIPNSGMDRNTFAMNANAKFVERLTLTTKVQYNIEKVRNRPGLSDSPGNSNYSIATLPPNIDARTLKGTTSKIGADETGEELRQNNNRYVNNPYWTAYQYEASDKRDRMLASAILRYDFTDWLYLQGRVGTDWYTSRRRNLTPYGTGGRGERYTELTELEIRQRETNAEFILGMDKTFNDIGVSAFVGGNQMRRSFEQIGLSGERFQVPYFHSITNFSSDNLTPIFGQAEVGINSLFGSTEVSYKNLVFLTFTGRKDWFSTLDQQSNSVFYPSAGLSFAFSDAIELPSWLAFGKVRAAWSQVGGAPLNAYRTNLTYNVVGGHQGAILGSANRNEVPNKNLKPLLVTEFEVGFDLRFLDNRIGLDLSYYNRKTTDDILSATVSESTGFRSAAVNVGEMSNKGIEIMLTGSPVTGAFKWDVSFNVAKNTNEVLKLVDGLDVIESDRSRTNRAFIHNRVGYPYSSIAGRQQKMINGQFVYNSDGFPVAEDSIVLLGNGVAPVTGGISNEFGFKNFNLSFLLGFQQGGNIHSGTNTLFYSNGLHKGTLPGRENGLTFTGMNTDGIQQQFNVPQDQLEDYYFDFAARSSGNMVYSTDYIKLRSLIFGYTLPNKLVENTPFSSVNLSFVARNLWLIYSDIENIDPESTYNNGNSQGLEYAGVPQSRTFGFNLKVKF